MQTKVITQRLQFRAMMYLLIVFMLCIPTRAQSKDEEVFDPIPAQLRARLIERMKNLIEYQRTQRWDKQYDLLSELVTQGDSKDEHVKRLQRWYAQGLGDNLINFVPKSVAVHNASVEYGEWTVFGCAKVREKGRIAEPYASVSVYREKDDWYFSPIGVITPIDGKAQPCPYEEEKTSQNRWRDSKSRKVKAIKRTVKTSNISHKQP